MCEKFGGLIESYQRFTKEVRVDEYVLDVQQFNNNNNNTIWGGSVLTGEEPPPHSGELNHALSLVGGPTQSQLSRPTSSRHHISMVHRLRRKQSNSDTNASNKTYLKERNFFFGKNEKMKKKNIKKSKNEEMNRK